MKATIQGDDAMPTQQTVLLIGGTGRTGGRVLQQLLGRGVRVRAVVRSTERLPAGVADAVSYTHLTLPTIYSV